MDHVDHRALAAQYYNRCWTLLETQERSGDLDAELLSCAFASRQHWHDAGGDEQLVIADWMVARAAAATGAGELSLHFAMRSWEGSQGRADWLVASAAEQVARSYTALGDGPARNDWAKRASDLVAAIGDDEDRAVIAEQLASLPDIEGAR